MCRCSDRSPKRIDPLTRWLGWRTDLQLQPFIATTGLSVEKVYKINKTSLYTVVLARKEPSSRYPTREL